MARAEAEKAAEALRDELAKVTRAAAEASAEQATAHEAAVAKLVAEHDKLQVSSDFGSPSYIANLRDPRHLQPVKVLLAVHLHSEIIHFQQDSLLASL